jgi:hypothetical protein
MAFPQLPFSAIRSRKPAIASSDLLLGAITLNTMVSDVKFANSDLVLGQTVLTGNLSEVKSANSDLVLGQTVLTGNLSEVKSANSDLILNPVDSLVSIGEVKFANSDLVLNPVDISSVGVLTEDPFSSMVQLLLYGNGVNNGTTFTDSSSNNRTVSAVGGVVTSTAQSKYGGSSLFFPSSGTNYLTTPVDSGLTFGSTDLTFESWVRFTSISATTAIMGNARAEGGDYGLFLCASSNEFRLRNWFDNNGAVFSMAIALDTWYHVAATKVGSTARIWVNGVEGTSGTVDSTNTSHTSFLVGYVYNNGGYADNFHGYLDSPRVTKGIARYTSGFNPENIYLN